MNDVIVIGGSVRLLSIPAVARQFGCTPEKITSWLTHWGIPTVEVDSTFYVSSYALERELLLRTSKGADEDSLDERMEWINKYHGRAHERAILEYLRHYQGAWKRATSRFKRTNRRDPSRPGDKRTGIPRLRRRRPQSTDGVLDGQRGGEGDEKLGVVHGEGDRPAHPDC